PLLYSPPSLTRLRCVLWRGRFRYTTLCRSLVAAVVLLVAFGIIETRSKHALLPIRVLRSRDRSGSYLIMLCVGTALFGMFFFLTDRKNTRLNSSHVKISYAVFCLKKKKISYYRLARKTFQQASYICRSITDAALLSKIALFLSNKSSRLLCVLTDVVYQPRVDL